MCVNKIKMMYERSHVASVFSAQKEKYLLCGKHKKAVHTDRNLLRFIPLNFSKNRTKSQLHATIKVVPEVNLVIFRSFSPRSKYNKYSTKGYVIN